MCATRCAVQAQSKEDFVAHKGIVYWSNRDGCYVGQCPSLFYGGVHGMNEKRVRASLDRVIRDWESTAKATPRPRRYAKRRTGHTRAPRR
jgi:hypothetical protein